MFSPAERRYLESARLGRLATADAAGRPNAVPVCFAIVDGAVATPIDEKPKGAIDDLRRVEDARENPRAAIVVDHWSEDWSKLGWVQIRGTADLVDPGAASHGPAVEALREKYDQYADHDLQTRPVLRIDPGSVVSWGRLER